MNKGRIETEGNVSEIFEKADTLRKIGLNVPQITTLCDRLRNAGLNLPENIYTVGYAADALTSLLGGGRNV